MIDYWLIILIYFVFLGQFIFLPRKAKNSLKANLVWRIFNKQKFENYKEDQKKEFNTLVQKLVIERIKEERNPKSPKHPLIYFIRAHPDIEVNFGLSVSSFFVLLASIMLQMDVGINAISTGIGGLAGLIFIGSTPIAIIQFIGILHKWRSQA